MTAEQYNLLNNFSELAIRRLEDKHFPDLKVLPVTRKLMYLLHSVPVWIKQRSQKALPECELTSAQTRVLCPFRGML